MSDARSMLSACVAASSGARSRPTDTLAVLAKPPPVRTRLRTRPIEQLGCRRARAGLASGDCLKIARQHCGGDMRAMKIVMAAAALALPAALLAGPVAAAPAPYQAPEVQW